MARISKHLCFHPALLLIALLALAACSPAATSPAPPPAAPATAEPEAPDGARAQVTYVFDGDTIEVELDGETYRLRYIGVDSPEREEPFYQAALDFNRDLVEDQTVVLVRDVSETDQYGRLLRYVYREDGSFVNAELIRNGMARLVTFPPDVAQTEVLRGLQDEARAAGTGMWGSPELVGPCDCDRNLYDCRDFTSREEAQTCFDYCQETTGQDVHNLDGGGDGLVCESLP
jgi:endonuclease YncB( thermonuclease family)